MFSKVSIILCGVLLTGTSARRVYNTEVFSIAPNTTRSINVNDDSFYNVLNVGRTKLYVEFVNEYNYNDVIDARNVIPGVRDTFYMIGNVKDIAIRITNYNEVRGLIHVAGVNKRYSEYDSEASDDGHFEIDGELLKTLISHGASYIPYVGPLLSTAISFFWPAPDEPSAWDEVKDKVEEMVDLKAQKTIKGILRGTLKNVEETLETCAEHLEVPENQGHSGEYFMNVADGLVGLEYQFIFHKEDDPDADNVNYYLLPMYIDVVNLKLLFYQYGIMNDKKIGLKSNQVRRLYSHIRRVTGAQNRGAMGHVTKLCRKKFDEEYNSSYPETIYQELLTVKTYCIINGFQHFPNWNAILLAPFQSKKPDNPVLIYSTSFGRSDAAQTSIITRDIIPPPLQPVVVNGKLNQPVYIKVVLFPDQNNYLISGMWILYDNDDEMYTGSGYGGGQFSREIYFEDSKLMNLTAHGTGQVNCLEFGFEDGRIEKVGYKHGEVRTFSLPRHHIVGFLMTGSELLPENLAANIVVGYQLINN